MRLRSFQCCGGGGRSMVFTNIKASVESGKLILKIRSESGKLSTIGCHFPLKSTNFWTLQTERDLSYKYVKLLQTGGAMTCHGITTRGATDFKRGNYSLNAFVHNIECWNETA